MDDEFKGLTWEQQRLLARGQYDDARYESLKKRFAKIGFAVYKAGRFIMITMTDAEKIALNLCGPADTVQSKPESFLSLVVDNDKKGK